MVPIGGVDETRVDVDGVEIFVRRRAGDGVPAVFLHGNPTNSDDWLPFVEAHRGPAIAFDLPGFGRSARPDPERFDYSMWAYADFVGRALDVLGVDRYALVIHDWGAVGLLAALRAPERVERLVAFNHVPFGVGYRWHWIARWFWRRRGAGELFNALTTRAAAALVLRQARPGWRPMPPEFLDSFWPHWDAGTKRAVLRLYRSADPEPLAAAGEGLERLTCPALLLWAQRDPYIPPVYGRRLAARLPNARLEEVVDAGHWAWIDRPELVGRVARALGRDRGGPLASL